MHSELNVSYHHLLQLCTESHKRLQISYCTARFTLYERADILTFLHNIIHYMLNYHTVILCEQINYSETQVTQHNVTFTLHWCHFYHQMSKQQSLMKRTVWLNCFIGAGVWKIQRIPKWERAFCFQCIDTVGWASEEHQASKKYEWWGAGVVICLQQGANDLHIVQLMPLPPHHLLLH